ncbi:hypothetical protein NRP93_003118 [Clostridium botulinum]|nr:hypothetical protein [Clostridium botulinum]
MELLYPDEYFLDLLEEELDSFNKDNYDYLTKNIDLNLTMEQLDEKYVESIIEI